MKCITIRHITGYMLTCRGTISVKGKGDMVTYFLDAMAPKEWKKNMCKSIYILLCLYT